MFTCLIERNLVDLFLQLVSAGSHARVLALQHLHLLCQVADVTLQLIPFVSQAVSTFGDLRNQVGVLCVPPINRTGVCNRAE